MLAQRYPEEALLHFQRGIQLERAYRTDEAAREYRRAIDRDPQLSVAHAALADFYRSRGLLAKAVDELHILANLEANFLVLFQLGYLLIELGRYEQAIDYLEQCLLYAPRDPMVRYRIALAHSLRGEYRIALQHLQGTDASLEAMQLRGDCCIRLGDFEQAQQAYEQAVVLAPPAAYGQVLACYQRATRYLIHGIPHTLRDWLYTEHGAILLGSPQLDHTTREPVDYPLLYSDIAVMLKRLQHLIQEFAWQFSCVIPGSQAAQPVATSMAALLELPMLTRQQAATTTRPLIVIASGFQAEMLTQLPAHATVFCLGLSTIHRHNHIPTIVGAAGHGTVGIPWEAELRCLRMDGAPRDVLSSCIQHATGRIEMALASTCNDTGHAALVAYYAAHRQHGMLTP